MNPIIPGIPTVNIRETIMTMSNMTFVLRRTALSLNCPFPVSELFTYISVVGDNLQMLSNYLVILHKL